MRVREIGHTSESSLQFTSTSSDGLKILRNTFAFAAAAAFEMVPKRDSSEARQRSMTAAAVTDASDSRGAQKSRSGVTPLVLDRFGGMFTVRSQFAYI